jgi:ammonia channel protein AmtB
VLIVNGMISERAQFHTYITVCVVIMGWIYPTVLAWVWNDGWLTNADNIKIRDDAGAGAIHLLGGTVGLIGCFFLKPRHGRFSDYSVTLTIPNTESNDPNALKMKVKTITQDQFSPHSKVYGKISLLFLWVFLLTACAFNASGANEMGKGALNIWIGGITAGTVVAGINMAYEQTRD